MRLKSFTSKESDDAVVPVGIKVHEVDFNIGGASISAQVDRESDMEGCNGQAVSGHVNPAFDISSSDSGRIHLL